MKTYNYIGYDNDHLVPFFGVDNESSDTEGVFTILELLASYDNYIMEARFDNGCNEYVWKKIKLDEIVFTKNGIEFEYFNGLRNEKINHINIYLYNDDEIEDFYNEDENDYVLVIFDDKDGSERLYSL